MNMLFKIVITSGAAMANILNAPVELSDASVVAKLDIAFQAAVKRNDAKAMDRILHPQFVLVLGGGGVISREQLIEEARRGDYHYDEQDEEPGSQTVRVWQDTAVVTAKLLIKGSGPDGAFDRKLWFSDTYVRTPQGWRYAFAQASLALPPTPSEETVDRASHAFDDAQFRKDRNALNTMLAPDFAIIHGDGRVGDRTDFMASFTDPKVTFEPFVIVDRVVTPLGADAALVRATGTIRGSNDGKSFVEHFQYTDTFRRTAGHWQVAFVQVTPLTE